MDTSNPVMNSDRVTIGEALERLQGNKRQKLEYLRELANRATRVVLPEGEVYPLAEVRTIQSQFMETIPTVSSEKTSGLDPKIFEVVMDQMPVCGLKDRYGVPLHPAGVNSSQGAVHVNRQLGKVAGKPEGLLSLIEAFGPEVLQRTSVYTSGTWSGFTSRLAEQMGRKTVSLQQTLSLSQGLKKPVSRKIIMDQLDKYMPRKPNLNWPGVHTTLEEALLGGIKITSNSSAGAPYWRNKGECLDDILFVGLPIVVDAIKSNSLPRLYRENPEMFLVEVKNKLDRYKIDELEKKTRPYVCVPAHWSFLFSMLTQGFQETLEVFDKTPGSCNAYGFSSSDGGLDRMVDWMRSADKRGKVCCYGDDACIVVRRGGTVYRVDPDFKQMDGSIDYDDVDVTIAWILRHLKRDLGETETPHFWKGVADVWRTMATNPDFILDGKTIWRKKEARGLMTGVPGTTLFDTVKSVIAWNAYLDQCATLGKDPLNRDYAVSTMAKWGLIIKPGTWNPSPLPESVSGNLITDHKFLGVQIQCREWRGRLVHIPHIPREEALEMMIVQKDDPYRVVKSGTIRSRTLFDRMRGMMITFGFAHPDITEGIHHVVNGIDPAVIIMNVQSGTGERPEHVTMQDFVYPDSSGFPSYDFCMSVYCGGERAEWLSLFDGLDLSPLTAEARAELRYHLKINPKDTPIVVRAEPLEERPLDPVLENALAFQAVQTPPKGAPVNKRSKIVKVEAAARLKEEKFLPPRGESIRLYLEGVGKISQIGTVCERFRISFSQLRKEAEKFALFLSGETPGDLVSLYPISTPYPTPQDSLVQEWKGKASLIDRGSTARRDALVRANDVKSYVKTAPEMVFCEAEFLLRLDEPSWKVDFPERPPRWLRPVKTELEALAGLNMALTTAYGGMRWKSLPVRVGQANPVGMQLYIGSSEGEERAVAEAWSASKKLAQQYVARSVYEINGLGFESTQFTTRYLPPPEPPTAEELAAMSWAEQMEVHLAEEEAEASPLQAPTVVATHPTNLEPAPQEVYDLIPDRNEADLAWLFAKQRAPKDPLALIRRIPALGLGSEDSSSSSSGVGMSPPNSPSRRVRASPEKKARLNRKLLERRKRKLQASSSPA